MARRWGKKKTKICITRGEAEKKDKKKEQREWIDDKKKKASNGSHYQTREVWNWFRNEGGNGVEKVWREVTY